jgi:hypothetical protein
MKINKFTLENYLSQHEILSHHLLCRSDAENTQMRDLLAMADEEDQAHWNSLQLGNSTALGMPSLRQLIGQEMYSGLKPHQIVCFQEQKNLVLRLCMRYVNQKIM